MSAEEGNKRKRYVLTVLKVNKKKKVVGELSATIEETSQTTVIAGD